MKTRKTLLAVLTIIIVAGMFAVPAYAYFTASTTVSGGLEIELPPIRTGIEEEIIRSRKEIVITNAWDGAPVYVRARAFSGSDEDLAGSCSGDGWSDGGDGWWYYDSILQPGTDEANPGRTTVLYVDVSRVLEKTEAANVGDSFNVVVVYESTPVQYDADGNGIADWSYSMDAGEGGN